MFESKQVYQQCVRSSSLHVACVYDCIHVYVSVFVYVCGCMCVCVVFNGC